MVEVFFNLDYSHVAFAVAARKQNAAVLCMPLKAVQASSRHALFSVVAADEADIVKATCRMVKIKKYFYILKTIFITVKY